jgi:hypothetical protein
MFSVISVKRFFSTISGNNATIEGGDGNEIEEPLQAPQAQGIQIKTHELIYNIFIRI